LPPYTNSVGGETTLCGYFTFFIFFIVYFFLAEYISSHAKWAKAADSNLPETYIG